jgi:hypothetical protein
MTMFGFARFSTRAIALVFAMIGSAFAGPSSWTGQGPFGGNIVTVKADPLVATRVYVATTNGFFRSDDGGASWTLAEAGLLTPHPANGVFAVSGTSAGGLYLFDDTGRLYASADAGNTWTATGYSIGQDLLQAQQNFALAAGAGNIVWIAADTLGLLKSSDSGATFAAAAGFPSGPGIEAINVATNPSAPQNLIVGVAGTLCNATSGACPIYTSVNSGAGWSAVVNPDGKIIASDVRTATQISFGPGSNVFVSYDNHGSGTLLSSSTNGSAWTNRSDLGVLGGGLAASRTDANVVVVGKSTSVNTGVNFTPLPLNGLTTNGVFVPGAFIALAADYGTSHRMWAGTGSAGMYLSNDSGTSWSESSDGMTATGIRALAVHPIDNTRIYAGFGDSLNDPSQAFYRSLASGTWTASNSGLNAYQLRSIYIDPTTTSTVGSTVIYASGSGFDSSPNTNNYNSGIYKSLDGGLTWSTMSGGIPVRGTGHSAGNLRTLIGDPRSCDNRASTDALCTTGPLKTLYVTGAGIASNDAVGTHKYRVMKSVDAGVTWADSSAGLPADSPFVFSCPSDAVAGVTPIVMDPTDSSTLYIGTFPFAFDAACNETTPHALSGVYKSTNGGATWTLASAGLPTYSGSPTVLETLSLAIDPNNPQTLWVSTKNLSTDLGAPGEIYKTVDGGANWLVSNAGINGPDIRALLVDANNPGTIYAASAGTGPANPGGVYKSTDGGADWISISAGFPATAATALALDPVDPSVLYAGTNGGVFTMVQLPDDDADGVPDLIENSGPNGGDANHDNSQDSVQTNVGTTAPGLFGAYGWQQGIANATREARTQQLKTSLKSLSAAQQGIQGGYFTVQVNSASCQQAVDVTADLPGPLGLDTVPHHGTYEYPRGLVHFEIPGCASSSVDVMFNAATFGPGWTWRYYGPSTPGDNSTMGWHDATSLVTSQIGTDWKIQLANGAFGSYRPASVNSILFKGGPAYNGEIFEDKFEQ